jgi:hypothetical protein
VSTLPPTNATLASGNRAATNVLAASTGSGRSPYMPQFLRLRGHSRSDTPVRGLKI